MAFRYPLVETLYSGQDVCSLCGGFCNGTPEPTHPIIGEGPGWAAWLGEYREEVRPQPAHPMNTNGTPDYDPRQIGTPE